MLSEELDIFRAQFHGIDIFGRDILVDRPRQVDLLLLIVFARRLAMCGFAMCFGIAIGGFSIGGGLLGGRLLPLGG